MAFQSSYGVQGQNDGRTHTQALLGEDGLLDCVRGDDFHRQAGDALEQDQGFLTLFPLLFPSSVTLWSIQGSLRVFH